MIHIAIVEDEKLYIDQLQEYISRYREEKRLSIKTTVFCDGEDIVEDYRGDYDIILFDIQMKFMDGMTAAEKIREIDLEVKILFITNMTQYAIRGYQVDAMDYVVKPVEYFAFSRKLDKAISRIRKKQQAYLTISSENGVRKLNIAEILYIESQAHNAVYYTRTGSFISRASLKDLEPELEKYGFFRCSKGYLVNMRLIDGVTGGDCLIGNVRIPISRNKKREFMEKMLLCINEEDD